MGNSQGHRHAARHSPASRDRTLNFGFGSRYHRPSTELKVGKHYTLILVRALASVILDRL